MARLIDPSSQGQQIKDSTSNLNPLCRKSLAVLTGSVQGILTQAIITQATKDGDYNCVFQFPGSKNYVCMV